MISKRNEVFSILVSIVFLLSGIYHLDWWRLTQDPLVVPLSVYTEGAKLTVAYLTALLDWRNDPSCCWDEADIKALRIIYTLIAIADSCFIFQNPDAGILVFMVVQTLFIKRHLQGGSFQDITGNPRLMAVFAASFGFCCMSACFFWYPRTGINDTFIVLSIYFTLKSTSLLATYTACVIGKMPTSCAQLTAIGMTAFFICDHTVTGNFAPESGNGRILLHHYQQLDVDVLWSCLDTLGSEWILSLYLDIILVIPGSCCQWKDQGFVNTTMKVQFTFIFLLNGIVHVHNLRKQNTRNHSAVTWVSVCMN